MAGEGASVGQLLESDLSQSKKSELLEICSSERCPCLKGAQLVKWGRILGGTVWSQDPWGQRKNGSVCGAGKLVLFSKAGRGLSAEFAINHILQHDPEKVLCAEALQRAETW